MALTKEQIADLLTRTKGNTRVAYTEEQRKARTRAMALAAGDARTALVSLHPDEYRELYEAAKVQRLAEIESA